MGTGLGPSWFSHDFPAVAARREPFPDVERWQTMFVRYSLSDAATQGIGWVAESCRRNLHNIRLAEHPLLRHNALPENINIRIVEAPAEFVLPVKQDRRLLPSFKVRLEVQHSGPVSVPLTLRAHVLSQQDKEGIASWTPPDDTSSKEGKRAPTELKGTSCIRCTLETGITGELRTVGGTGKETQAQGLQSAGLILYGGGASGLKGLSFTHGGVLRADTGGCGGRDIVKPEQLYRDSSYSYPGGGLGQPLSGYSDPAAGAPQHQRSFRALADMSGLDCLPMCSAGNKGGGIAGTTDGQGHRLRDMNRTMLCGALAPTATATAGGSSGGGRGVSRGVASPFGTLFAADRPEPVLTLASCVRMTATSSTMVGLGLGDVSSCGVRLAGSADYNGGSGVEESRDAFDAAVEMLIQCSSQQQEQQQQQQRHQQHQVYGEQQGSGQQPQVLSHVLEAGPAGDSSSGGPRKGGKLMLSTQDFEFTNLEFLKPTRMNKVYMAFTVAIHETDLLFVVFNIPTIGICRAEQREKACKKLNIDYKLLSRMDYGVGASAAPDPAASMQPATATGLVPVSVVLSQNGSDGAGVGGCGSGLCPSSLAVMGGATGRGSGEGSIGLQNAASLSVARLTHGQCPMIHPQQQLQHPGAHQEEIKYGPAGSGAPPDLSTDQCSLKMLGQQQQQMGSGSPILQHLPDNDFPRLMAQMNLHQQQQIHQQGMVAGVMTGGAAMAMTGGGMMTSNLYRGGMLKSSITPGSGNGGTGHGGRMLSGGIAFGIGGTAATADLMCSSGGITGGMAQGGCMVSRVNSGCRGGGLQRAVASSGMTPTGGSGMWYLADGSMGVDGGGGRTSMGMGPMDICCGGNGKGRKRDQGQTEEDINYRCAPVHHHPPPAANSDLPAYTGFAGLNSSDVEMLLPTPHSRLAMRDFIFEVYDSTGLHRKLTQMDIQALLSQAGFPMDSNREHDTISPQQWDEFCGQFRSIVHTLQQVAPVWNMDDPVVISGFDMDRAGTITALGGEPAGTFICRFSMSQPGCLVLTCKVGKQHVRADNMGLLHAIIKIDDLAERRVDTWIRDYVGATHLLDVYRQKRVDKRKVFATNYTRLRLEAGEGSALSTAGTSVLV